MMTDVSALYPQHIHLSHYIPMFYKAEFAKSADLLYNVYCNISLYYSCMHSI